MSGSQKKADVEFPEDKIVIGLSPKMGQNPETEAILLAAIRLLHENTLKSHERFEFVEKEMSFDSAEVTGAKEFMIINGLSDENLFELAILVMASYQKWLYTDIESQLKDVLS